MPRSSFLELAVAKAPSFRQKYENFAKFLFNNYNSPGTQSDYLRSVARVVMTFGLLPEEITSEQYTDYYYSLTTSEGQSESSFKLARYGVKSYFDCFNIPCPPAAFPKRFKPKRIPVIPSVPEMQDMLSSTGDDLTAKAVLAFMSSTAARKSETLSLELRHLDFDRDEIVIYNGKGAVDRALPMDPILKKVLRKYIRAERPVRYLFESAPGVKQNAYFIERTIETARVRCGISKHLTPHSMRHFAASYMSDCGVPVREIQRRLGHKRLDTTERYLHELRSGKNEGWSRFGILEDMYKDYKGPKDRKG